MASGSAFRPNPRTQQVAARLMADAMQDVAAGMLAGRDHYAERDRVLHDLAPAWIKVAGKDAADAAVRGMHFLEPGAYLKPHEREALPLQQATEQRALRDHQAARDAEYRAYLVEHAPHLLPKRVPILRRAAMALLALLLAAGGLLAGSGYNGMPKRRRTAGGRSLSVVWPRARTMSGSAGGSAGPSAARGGHTMAPAPERRGIGKRLKPGTDYLNGNFGSRARTPLSSPRAS